MGDPCSPEREIGETSCVFRTPNHPGRNATFTLTLRVSVDILLSNLPVSEKFSSRILDRTSVVVRVEFVGHSAIDGSLPAIWQGLIGTAETFVRIVLPHILSLEIKRIGGEVHAEIRSVAENRPMIHQPVRLKDRLSGLDLLVGSDRRAIGSRNFLGYRWRVLIGVERASTHDDEVAHEHHDQDLRERFSSDLHDTSRV